MRRRGGKAGQERSPPDDTGEETDGPVVLPPEDKVRGGKRPDQSSPLSSLTSGKPGTSPKA